MLKWITWVETHRINKPYFANALPQNPPGLPCPSNVLEGDVLPGAEMVGIVLLSTAL